MLARLPVTAFYDPQTGGLPHPPVGLLTYRATLRRLTTLAATRIHPGHGRPFSDPALVIASTLGAQKCQAGRVLAWLPEHGASVLEITHGLYPSLEPNNLYPALTDVRGGLDLLAYQGRISIEGDQPAHFVPRPFPGSQTPE